MMLPFPDDSFIYSWYTIGLAFLGGFLYYIRALMKGGQCISKASLKGKVAVVTGANSGIGKETAIELAWRGARVYIACRDEELGKAALEDVKKEAKNTNVFLLKLDLASFKSIRDFAAAFKKRESELHILVNNAGIMLCPQDKSQEGFELHFTINYLGQFLLTHLLLDVLKESAPSRIVCVGAVAYKLGSINLDDINYETEEYTPGKAYARSKLALTLFVRKLAEELKDTKVTVNIVHPGVVKTRAHRHMPLYNTPFIAYSFAPFIWFFMKPARDGAQTSIHCAVAEDMEEVTGKYFKDCEEEKYGEVANDEDLMNQLWEQTFRWVGLERGAEVEEDKVDE